MNREKEDMLTISMVSRLLWDRVCLLFLSREGGIESFVAVYSCMCMVD